MLAKKNGRRKNSFPAKQAADEQKPVKAYRNQKRETNGDLHNRADNNLEPRAKARGEERGGTRTALAGNRYKILQSTHPLGTEPKDRVIDERETSIKVITKGSELKSKQAQTCFTFTI